MRFSPTSSKDRFVSLILSIAVNGVLSSGYTIKYTIFNILSNKSRPRTKPCGIQDKISSQELKNSYLYFIAYGLINNPEVSSRKMHKDHWHAVYLLKDRDKDNRMLVRSLLTTLKCFDFVISTFLNHKHH